MDQVINHGATDAMREIQECMKQLIVIDQKKKQYDAQIKFQEESEQQIDTHTDYIKAKLKDLENKAQQLGIDTQNDKDESDEYLRDPKLLENQKKKIEKNALIAIHKKFYAKLKEQKEKLESKLMDHNDFLSTAPTKAEFRSKSSNDTRSLNAEVNNKIAPVIDIETHELVQEINSHIEDLKPCLPNITSRLPWVLGTLFKRQSTSQNTRYGNSIKFKSVTKSFNVNSVKELSDSKEPTLKSYKNLQIGNQPPDTIKIIKSDSKRRIVHSQNRTPFEKPTEHDWNEDNQ